MPAATAGKNLPYPLGTDRVMDGDDQIRKLAQSVDNMVQCGSVQIAVSAVNTPVSVNVVFPVPFSVAPTVVVTAITNNPHQVFASMTAQTAAGCIVWGARNSGTIAFTVFWVAIGPVTAVA